MDVIKYDFSSNSKRQKNFFTSLSLDPKISLKEMDQKFPNAGLIGSNSCVIIFANSKIFRIVVILHDANGFVKSTTH